MSDQGKKIEFYGLTTCGWCKKTKQWLDDHRLDYKVVYVDLAEEAEKAAAKERVLSFVERMAMPIIIINDGEEVIQGYKPDKFEECMG